MKLGIDPTIILNRRFIVRVLTTYELDLVAGGFGSTDDAQINGVGGPHGNGSGYGGGGGGGGGDAYSSGSWVHLPPASYFGNYPPGGNGTWVWLPSGGGGGAGGNSGPVAKAKAIISG